MMRTISWSDILFHCYSLLLTYPLIMYSKLSDQNWFGQSNLFDQNWFGHSHVKFGQKVSNAVLNNILKCLLL